MKAAEKTDRIGILPKTDRFLTALRGIFAVSFFLYGLRYEIGSAVISVCLMILLIRKSREGLRLRLNAASAAVFVLALFYFLSAFWAVDSWTALRGGIAILPVPLFLLCLMQTGPESRMRLLRDLPYLGAAMTALSLILGQVPSLSGTFWWRGRLAGLFGYPNVYACFLLVGLESLLLTEPDEKHEYREFLCGGILFVGLLLSGSRFVFVLTVAGLAAALFLRRNSHTALVILGSVAAGCVFDLIFILLTGSGSGSTSRVLEISADSYSLLARLLYWKDALPVIGTHPFGLGSLGYSFLQGSIQTGVYTVRFVHNSFLQILLDVGWIPAGAALAAVLQTLLSKRSGAAQRLMLLTLILHCLLDFDLEYVSMYFILLCLLDWDCGREGSVRIPIPAETVPAVLLSVFGLYVGTASSLMYHNRYDEAFQICPWDTVSETAVMEKERYISDQKTLAEDILSRNSFVASAWDAMALSAYAENDFESYTDYKRTAISCARYDMEEYREYFRRLEDFYEGYSEAADTEGMAACLSEIASIREMLEELEAGTDDLAWRMDGGLDFSMPEEYGAFFAEHGGMQR